MWALLSKIFKDWFTGVDGVSYDVGKALWVGSSVLFGVLAAWAVMVNEQPFDALQYGGGLGLVLAAGGAAIGMKAKTEPSEKTVEVTKVVNSGPPVQTVETTTVSNDPEGKS